jgi:hypothetical protein
VLQIGEDTGRPSGLAAKIQGGDLHLAGRLVRARMRAQAAGDGMAGWSCGTPLAGTGIKLEGPALQRNNNAIFALQRGRSSRICSL